MELRKFRLIHRNLQAKLPKVDHYSNTISKKMWVPYAYIAFDDDLDLWKGSGPKKKVQKKAAKTGQMNWKAVDEHKYFSFVSLFHLI